MLTTRRAVKLFGRDSGVCSDAGPVSFAWVQRPAAGEAAALHIIIIIIIIIIIGIVIVMSIIVVIVMLLLTSTIIISISSIITQSRARGIWKAEGNGQPMPGWHYMSKATCLMWPHSFYMFFVVSGIIMICYILRHF